MNLKNLQTDRLILIPVTLEITNSLMEGSRSEIEKLGITAHENWPREDTKDILPIVNESLKKNKVPSGFEFWMIVMKENMEIIGDIGFHGKPDAKGEVEIGYGLVEEERRKGYGYEAAREIMDWAFEQEEVKVVRAECLIGNAASVRVLEKIGMVETGRDEELIYWEFRRG